jgi:hypothetical protein
MILNVFSPKFCLTSHLSSSWSVGVYDSVDEKIPVEVAQGIPRLKFSQCPESKEDWFCGVIALDPAWASVDLESFKFLSFNFYADDNLCCRVGLKDASDNDSVELEMSRESNCAEGQESHLCIDLSRFSPDKGADFNPSEARLLKVVGYNNSAFYISEVSLSDAPST